jgi:hypothetical protein
VEQARTATTADLNNDGFVTLDEVVAMKQAGLTDSEMIERLRATRQVFQLTDEQRRYLADRGVSSVVVDQMVAMNQSTVLTPAPAPLPAPTPLPAPAPSDSVVGRRSTF